MGPLHYRPQYILGYVGIFLCFFVLFYFVFFYDTFLRTIPTFFVRLFRSLINHKLNLLLSIKSQKHLSVVWLSLSGN